KDQIDDMEILSEDDYPSKEVMLEKDPDFVIGSERTFNDNGVGSIDELDELGIDAYATESEKPETIDNMVYKQIEEIAEIFRSKKTKSTTWRFYLRKIIRRKKSCWKKILIL